MRKQDVDYSLYLVTDSTPAVLGPGRDVCAVVEAALPPRGSVTCVQFRDKTGDTGALVATARRLHALTQRAGVPLLVNDRVDVALAVGCEGVHIGQDDVDLATARRLLGEDKIIGVSVSNVEGMLEACRGGADYLGIGTVFATATKENTKSIIGVDGLQQILLRIPAESPVKTVCIGGINASNTSRVAWQSSNPAPHHSLDGIAVVSAIMGAANPEAASRELLRLFRTPPPFAPPSPRHTITTTTDELLRRVPDLVRAVVARTPLSHNMTNLVVQNLAANVALAVGASPIMANYGEEAADLARLGGALVVNMGTVTPEGLANYLKALEAYNGAGRPVVYDPVGAGATAVRRAATKTILGAGYIDVLKGNQSEVRACIAASGMSDDQTTEVQQQRGVDSGPGEADAAKLGAAIRDLSTLRKNVVVATGKTDYVTAGGADGPVFAVDNGDDYLGMVTGTGCCLGTTISAYVAVAAASPEDRLPAVVAALLHYNIAAELAAARDDVRGPGTFVPAFLDELYCVRNATVDGDLGWLKRARVSVLL
ncbi:hypothetical protein DL769_001943 [Monosporascus sp. CRB-8-3]|nr:hypothetical protein DL769_001943 [Monosporascus sp. CRB-8-3]